jgi:hypothetical protein
MAKDDYAIVVGISKYPGLGGPAEPADLEASEIDAREVYAWLIDPAGGAVPKGNIQLLCTSDFQGQSPEPERERIRQAFRWLLKQVETAPGGRRLYLYMSGHGFSPSRYRGALYVANATPDDPLNTNTSGWLEWFQDNGYFKEFVLWMDCCMDRQFSVPVDTVFQPTGTFQPAGPTFIGFAATRPLKTVERPIPADGGRIHGIFTWTLLRGLKGDAVDAAGQITARSLGDYLINGMGKFLTPADSQNPNITKEPEIVRADRALIFAEGQQQQRSPVTLQFPPGAVNQQAILWRDIPPKGQTFTIVAQKSVHDLTVGLYVIEVPDLNLRHGFEVTGTEGSLVEVNTQGTRVVEAQPEETFVLTVMPNQMAAEIFLINQQLSKQAQSRRILAAAFPFGIYKVKIRIGRSITESIIFLDGDIELQVAGQDSSAPDAVLSDLAAQVNMSQPVVASAAPLPGSSLSHEFHTLALDAMAQPASPTNGAIGSVSPTTAEIQIMARVWSGRQPTLKQVRPWQHTELLDAEGGVLSRLIDLPAQSDEGDPFVTQQLAVSPGTYFLRHRLGDGRVLECALTVPSGWTVQAFLLAVAAGENETPTPPEALQLNRYTILMKPVGQRSTDTNLDQVLETARLALIDERRILNKELETLLLGKFENPMAGILGAHLLLLEEERRPGGPSRRFKMLDEVIGNLRRLVGDSHPDVEALSLRCPTSSLRAAKPFRMPPIFDRSWRLIVEASQTHPELLPDELWNRVHASIPVSGYLLWCSDQKSKEAHQRQLAKWVKDATSTELEMAANSQGEPGSGLEAMAAPKVQRRAKLSTKTMSELARQLRVPPGSFRSLLKEVNLGRE